MSKELTPKIKEVLECYNEYLEKFGSNPRPKDLCEALSISESLTYQRMDSLKRKGLINK